MIRTAIGAGSALLLALGWQAPAAAFEDKGHQRQIDCYSGGLKILSVRTGGEILIGPYRIYFTDGSSGQHMSVPSALCIVLWLAR